MKRNVVIILFLFITGSLSAETAEYLTGTDCTVLLGQKYGDYKENVFDIFLPKSATPSALVIYFHGGGFTGGDKKEGIDRSDDVKYFLENNIAFATVNYRFYNSDDSVGVLLCLNDIKRALQYIRYNAGKYNINKELIGCYGTSAGAGASLYLAFSDDFAVKGDKTLSGESTRIKCAGAISTQATYNLFRWMKYIPCLRLIICMKRKQFYPAIANFYGYRDYKSFRPMKKAVTARLDMLDMIDSTDPPVYIMNLQKETFPKDYNIIEHHCKHALILARILKKNNVKNVVYVYSSKVNTESDIDYPVRKFFADNLRPVDK